MDDNSNEDIPNAHPNFQVIEQGDASDSELEATSSHLLNRSRFRVVVEEGALAPMPPRELSYFEWSIVTDRFMDAYDRGLNGKQAAWAARKYRGHRVLPSDIFEELGKEGIV